MSAPECCACGSASVAQVRHGYYWCSSCWASTLPPISPLERALREEVDQLCDEVVDEHDRITVEVNYRLRETLLRIADRIKESA